MRSLSLICNNYVNIVTAVKSEKAGALNNEKSIQKRNNDICLVNCVGRSIYGRAMQTRNNAEHFL